MFALCQTVGKESCLKPTTFESEAILLGSFGLLRVFILYSIWSNFDLMLSLVILLPRLLNSYSDIEAALASRACQMGVTGNAAALVALALEESVLHSLFLSFLRPVSGSVLMTFVWPSFYVLSSLGTRKHDRCSIEFLSEIGKEACDQLIRVAGKVGKFQSSTVAETYLFWCRTCARITVKVSHDVVNCVISSQWPDQHF